MGKLLGGAAGVGSLAICVEAPSSPGRRLMPAAEAGGSGGGLPLPMNSLTPRLSTRRDTFCPQRGGGNNSGGNSGGLPSAVQQGGTCCAAGDGGGKAAAGSHNSPLTPPP
ncbi:hypothetical protein Vretimale_1133, partial [Volvox reticuliferus]